MAAALRTYRPEDLELALELSLRAWAPVFASLEQVLGSEVFVRLRGDWRQSQADDVRAALADEEMEAWVAEIDGKVVGFTVAKLHRENEIGEIWMLAVDPDHQRGGIGKALTQTAVEWFRESEMKLAMVETGGDPGHLPARHNYERSGFSPLPVSRFFKAL